MTAEQKCAIRLLSRCRMYQWRERDRVKALRLMLECDPDTDIGWWEDHKLMEYLHKYRRQHGRCSCLACLNVRVGAALNPHNLSLFAEGEERG